MNGAASYFSPLFALRARIGCWVRVTWREGASIQEGDWGQLLTIPTEGYLEGPDGPMPIRAVEWVDISTHIIKGGRSGQPREMIDVKDEIIAGLQATQLRWELRQSKWSVAWLFEEEEPVEVIRIPNPFGPTPQS